MTADNSDGELRFKARRFTRHPVTVTHTAPTHYDPPLNALTRYLRATDAQRCELLELARLLDTWPAPEPITRVQALTVIRRWRWRVERADPDARGGACGAPGATETVSAGKR